MCMQMTELATDIEQLEEGGVQKTLVAPNFMVSAK
jgi:hypothetical protein